jgi:hypothetical protein
MGQSQSSVRRASALVWSGAFSLGLGACGGQGADAAGLVATRTADLVTDLPETGSLSAGPSCELLLTELRSQLLAQVSARALEARVAPSSVSGFFADPVPTRPGAAVAAALTATLGSPVAPSGFSGTTLEVPGVDEADFIKAEGDRIYVLNGSALYVIDAAAGDSTQVLASIQIEAEQTRLLVRDGKVLVFSRVYGAPAGIEELGLPSFYFPSFTKLTLLDARSGSLEVEREIYVEGELNDARRQGSVVRGVILQDFRSRLDDLNVSYVDAFGRPRSQAQIDLQVDVWVRLATESIEATTLEDYLPIAFERVGGHLVKSPQVCAEYYLPPSGLNDAGSTRIVSLDLDGDAPLEGVSVVGKADSFYLDDEALILQQADYVNVTAADPTMHTNLHRFALDGVHVRHTASGRLRGYLQHRLGLDQSKGVVRALNIESVYAPTPGGAPGELSYVANTSRIVTLSAADGDLTELGRLELGEGASLYAAGFAGNRALVVSSAGPAGPSRLFVVDLGDPALPRVAGSLELPGYATLFLPLPGDRLLGVGQVLAEADALPRLALTLIDASSPSAPALLHQYVYAEPSFVEPSFEPHLITFDPQHRRFALPVQSSATNLVALDVFEVSADSISLAGSAVPERPDPTLLECLILFGQPTDPESLARLQEDPAFVEALWAQCRLNLQPRALRGLFRDQTVYSLTNLDLAAYDSAALSEPPLSQVALPEGWYPFP